MEIRASKRLSLLKPYPFAEVDEVVRKLKKDGVKVIDFGVGDPTEETPDVVRKAVKKGIDERSREGYPSYIGSYEFRVAISKWFKKRFDVVLNPEYEISSTIGSKEGIFNFHEAIIDPDDIVLCPEPGYPPYRVGTIFAEGIVYPYPLLKENNFFPDFSKIPTDVLKRAKLIWLNYPNSPTGKCATADFYKEAIKFAKKYNLIIASDEAYSEIYYNEHTHSILEFGREGIIVFQSLSKRSAMTGYRVGFVAGDRRIIEIFRKLKMNIDSGTATFIQDGAISALKDEEHVKKMRENYKKKRDILLETFKKLGMEDCTPEGTIYIWQKVPEGMDGLSFSKRLLEHDIGVVTTAGINLCEDRDPRTSAGNLYVRFALVPSIEETKEAAKRILKSFSSKI